MPDRLTASFLDRFPFSLGPADTLPHPRAGWRFNPADNIIVFRSNIRALLNNYWCLTRNGGAISGVIRRRTGRNNRSPRTNKKISHIMSPIRDGVKASTRPFTVQIKNC